MRSCITSKRIGLGGPVQVSRGGGVPVVVVLRPLVVGDDDFLGRRAPERGRWWSGRCRVEGQTSHQRLDRARDTAGRLTGVAKGLPHPLATVAADLAAYDELLRGRSCYRT